MQRMVVGMVSMLAKPVVPAGDEANMPLKVLPLQIIELQSGVLLKRGCTEFKVSGEGASKIVRQILSVAHANGITREEICHTFPPEERKTVDTLVEQLVARHLLVPSNKHTEPSNDGTESPLDILYWHFGQSASQVLGQLNSHHFVIVGINTISRQLAASLRESGVTNVTVVDDPRLRNLRFFDQDGNMNRERWPSSLPFPLPWEDWERNQHTQPLDCLVGTSDFGGQEELRKWNSFCLARSSHFLPIVLKNLIGYVGPLIIPGETACFECLRMRQNAHMESPPIQRAAETAAFDGQHFIGYHPSMTSVLGTIAAFELTKFYSGVLPLWNVGTLLEVNLFTCQMTKRTVQKIPRCLVCSPLMSRPPITPHKTNFVPLTQETP